MISLHYNVNLGIVTNIITSSPLQFIDSLALLLAYFVFNIIAFCNSHILDEDIRTRHRRYS